MACFNHVANSSLMFSSKSFKLSVFHKIHMTEHEVVYMVIGVVIGDTDKTKII